MKIIFKTIGKFFFECTRKTANTTNKVRTLTTVIDELQQVEHSLKLQFYHGGRTTYIEKI